MATGKCVIFNMLMYSNQHIMRLRVCKSSLPSWSQLVPSRLLLLFIASYLEKAMATHSSTLAWKIPWTEEPGRLQSMGLQRVGHDWATEHACMYLSLLISGTVLISKPISTHLIFTSTLLGKNYMATFYRWGNEISSEAIQWQSKLQIQVARKIS